MQNIKHNNTAYITLIIIIINCKTYEKKLVKPVQNKRRLIFIVKQTLLCFIYVIPQKAIDRILKYYLPELYIFIIN